MKSTKVQNPQHKCVISCVDCTMPNALSWKLATPRVVAVLNAWCSQFSLQHGLAVSVGIVWAKLNVVDNRCIPSGASLCVKQRKLTAGKSAYWFFAPVLRHNS